MEDFTHFLVFTDYEIEVFEPEGFDASNFVIDQDNYARDTYTFNDKIDFTFKNEKGSPLETPRTLNNGVLLTHQESGFRFLVEENRRFGSEANVKYKLKKNGIEFTIASFDFSDCETDNKSYIKIKLIQNGEQAKVKKREGLKVDLFSSKDLDENTISPIQTQKLLLRSTPIYGESTWSSPTGLFNYRMTAEAVTGNDAYFYYNPCKESIKYEIENSLSFLDTIRANTIEDFDLMNNFAVIEAVEQLTDIKISITDFLILQNTDVDNGGNGYLNTNFKIVWGYSTLFPIGVYEPYNATINEFQTFTYNQDINYTIKSLPKGAKVWIFGRSRLRQSATGGFNPIFETFTTLSAFNTKITANSVSVPTVIEAVRYSDLIKQTYKGINTLPVEFANTNIENEFKNNFCYTGKLIKQKTDKPFYCDVKEVKDSLLEANGDIQINDENIIVGKMPDYYNNVDMGGFLIKPDSNFKITKNEKYLINEFNIGFDKYENERDGDGKFNSVHTESQWHIPASNSMNKKDVKLNFTRDPRRIEYTKRKNTRISDNADDSDDEIFKSEVVPLPPSSRGNLQAYLRYSSNGTRVTILSDDSFSWDLLGFKVGNTIKINGNNVVVYSFTAKNLVVNYISPVISGSMVFNIDYPLTDVQYVTRTGEGLIYSENLQNADKYGNLKYTLKRIVKNWYPYLATAGQFIENKAIKNTFFKNNGECITQFSDEPNRIKENADIEIVDISSFKLINQNIVDSTVLCSTERMEQLRKDIQTKRGFLRIQYPDGSIMKGFPKKVDGKWKYEELNLKLEEKHESDLLIINYTAGTLTINEVGYDVKTVTEKRYNIFNDYIQFFDENNINLCNRTHYTKVQYNGVVYNSVDELLIAIG